MRLQNISMKNTVITLESGATVRADKDGFVEGVSEDDALALRSAGWALAEVRPGELPDSDDQTLNQREAHGTYRES